jgi:hypothetical protein
MVSRIVTQIPNKKRKKKGMTGKSKTSSNGTNLVIIVKAKTSLETRRSNKRTIGANKDKRRGNNTTRPAP